MNDRDDPQKNILSDSLPNQWQQILIGKTIGCFRF